MIMDIGIALDHLEKIFTILAIIVGGIWAYFNFFKSRLYRIRLEPGISGELIQKDEKRFIKVKLSLKNAGVSVVNIQPEGTGFRLNALYAKGALSPKKAIPKTRIKTYPIFPHHKWVESNETIHEEQLIVAPDGHNIAFELEMRVVAHGISFRANCIVENTDTN
jgi:hypothetical protein